MVVALGIDLVVCQYGREIVAIDEEFFCLMKGAQFFSGDAENGGGIGRKSQRFRLGETIGT